jgi:hypothetical protein
MTMMRLMLMLGLQSIMILALISTMIMAEDSILIDVRPLGLMTLHCRQIWQLRIGCSDDDNSGSASRDVVTRLVG